MDNFRSILKQYWINISIIIFLFIVLTLMTTFGHDSNVRFKKYNGLVVTDKQGNSYMIRGSQYNFTINDFDVNKMRLIE